MRKNTGLLTLLALFGATLSFGSVAAAATTTVVRPGSLDGWAITTSSGGTASAGFVAGPGAPPLGSGSAELSVGSDGSSGVQLRNASFNGVKLGDLTSLEYSTYVTQDGSGGQAPYLILSVDQDADGDVDDNLFFEPVYQTGAYGGDAVPNQGAPVVGVWQAWNALAGGWWSLGAGTFGPPLTTIATYTAAHPQAVIRNSAAGGGLRVVAGFGAGAWDDFVGSADSVKVGVSGSETAYDFEPAQMLGDCLVSDDGSTIRLLADCTTDATVVVPNGRTFDGDGHSLTAVDPAGGHFLGAVLAVGPGAATFVTDVEVTSSGLANVCDGGGDRLRGILFEGAGGSITDTFVHGVRQGPSGCQEGNAIEVRNAPFAPPYGGYLLVEIADNVVSDYQKNGITTNGSVDAVIVRNTVTGGGPITYTAQNGIQVGFGATALVEDNTVSGNDYTPADTVACGLLLFDAEGVKQRRNTFIANERDICNFGRGGGS